MRIEHIGDATLYLGDCLEILPTLGAVDAIITDPPYSSGGFTRGDRMADTATKYQSTGLNSYLANFAGDNRDQRSWMLWMSLWLGQTMKILKGGGMVCLFSDWRQLPACTDALQIAGLVWRGIAVWDKVNARPMPDRFRAQAEFVVWATNGPRSLDTHSDPLYHDGVFAIKSPPSAEREHSTQKPVELMKRLVSVARPGEVVVDPFMGSGSTGCGCARTGRRFIGIELTEHYFDTACRRIADAYKQPRLFEDEKPAAPAPQELPL